MVDAAYRRRSTEQTSLIFSMARSRSSVVCPADTQKRVRERSSGVAGKPTTTTASWAGRGAGAGRGEAGAR